MKHSVLKKSTLSTAIALSLAVSEAYALPDITVSNMYYLQGDTNYEASGVLKEDGTGTMNSVDPFFGHTWNSTQETVFLNSSDSWRYSDDGNDSNDTGPASVQGDYDYDADLAAMTANQIGVGLFFNWNTSTEIAVLEIFDCTSVPGVCSGSTDPAMANGPFAGSNVVFSGGAAPLECENSSVITAPEESVQVAIADLLATCINIFDTLTITGFEAATANGGTVTSDDTNFTYTPKASFEGPDSFTVSVNDGLTDVDIIVNVQVGGELQNNFTMLSSAGEAFGGTNDVDIVWDELNYNTNDVDSEGIASDTSYGLMTIESPTPFFNFNWKAHHVRIFQGPGEYKFDVTCNAADYDASTVSCDKPLSEQGASGRFLTMTLEDGEVGAHILFDWGKVDGAKPCGVANCDIDVINVWNVDTMWDDYGDPAPKNALWQGPTGVTPAKDANWRLVSIDANDDGIHGAPMIDGAFIGSYANFNYKPDKSDIPPPPYTGTISDVETGSFAVGIWSSIVALIGLFGLRRLQGSK